MSVLARKSHNTRKHIWVFILMSFILLSLSVMFGAAPSAHAQIIKTDCETTEIYQPGVGWIPGSAITKCTSILIPSSDGSQLLAAMNNSCGFGNPCPEAPPDTDDGLTEEQECKLEQAVDSERDRLANEIADGIRSRNTATLNPDNAEFGSFVLRLDNGQYVGVPPGTNGNTRQISLRNMLNVATTSYPGITASNIVAIVHSHPRDAGPGFANVSTIGQLSDLDYGNTMPSHPNLSPGPNDWVNGRNFLLANGRTSVADVSHYILGPDGVLRQYNYADGHPAEATEQRQLIDDAEANAKGECP